MKPWIFVAALALPLAACGSGGDRNAKVSPEARHKAAPEGADAMASHDAAPGNPVIGQDDQPRPIMQAQVVLDRLGFGPGVIDGKMGLSTENALSGFQEAHDLDVTGKLDDATRKALTRYDNIPATRVVTIPADFAQGPFQPIPDNPEAEAKMSRLGYASLEEKLAERFHTTPQTLRALNPQVARESAMDGASATPGAASPSAGASASASSSTAPEPWQAGMQIRVPNVGADAIDPSKVKDHDWLATLRSLGVGTNQPHLAKIVVSKHEGTLKGYDDAGKLVAEFTVTTGSQHDPLPLGDWKINGISYNPKYHYNPDLFWDASDNASKVTLPPGPNGPVGVVWIDLSKPHYGIHGTPEPEEIGRTQSHGCVRLTNWDAARLAQMVSPKTKVEFVA